MRERRLRQPLAAPAPRSSRAAAPPCSRPESAARTLLSRARSTAASPPTASSLSAKPPARTSPRKPSSRLPRPMRKRRLWTRPPRPKGRERLWTSPSLRWRRLPNPSSSLSLQVPRRVRPALPRERADQNLHRLWTEGSSSRARQVRRAGRPVETRRDAPLRGPRGLHVRAARVLRARGFAAGFLARAAQERHNSTGTLN